MKGSNGATPNVMVAAASTGRLPDLRPEVLRSSGPEVYSSLFGAQWLCASWVPVGVRMAAGQNPLANDGEKKFPAWFLYARWGKMHPAGRHDDWRDNITEVDNGRAAPGSGLCWQHCGVAAKLQPEN
jgi:hypothetical protein